MEIEDIKEETQETQETLENQESLETPTQKYDIPNLLEIYKITFSKLIDELRDLREVIKDKGEGWEEKRRSKYYDSFYEDDDKFYKVETYLREKVIPHKLAVLESGLEMLSSDWFKDLENFRPVFEYLLVDHDKSKFTAIEAIGYAYHDFKSKEEDIQFERAWHHHKMNNPHHPEYWLNPNRKGVCEPLPMPFVYVLEMVADWQGAGKTYGSSLKEWLPKNLPNFIFHKDTLRQLQLILNCIGINTEVKVTTNYLTVVE